MRIGKGWEEGKTGKAVIAFQELEKTPRYYESIYSKENTFAFVYSTNRLKSRFNRHQGCLTKEIAKLCDLIKVSELKAVETVGQLSF